MTQAEQETLADVHQTLKDEDIVHQTSYILQFLWRDLTSKYP